MLVSILVFNPNPTISKKTHRNFMSTACLTQTPMQQLTYSSFDCRINTLVELTFLYCRVLHPFVK